jgi:hypothetical protein
VAAMLSASRPDPKNFHFGLCAAADYLFETVRYEDPQNGPILLSFYLPAA